MVPTARPSPYFNVSLLGQGPGVRAQVCEEVPHPLLPLPGGNVQHGHRVQRAVLILVCSVKERKETMISFMTKSRLSRQTK